MNAQAIVAAIATSACLVPVGSLTAATSSRDAAVAKARATTNAKKIAVLRKRLVRLRHAATPLGPVRSLVTRLSRLSPRRSAVFLGIGLTKLAPINAKQLARILTNQVVSIVKRSGVPSTQIQAITRKVQVVERRYVPPAPTPTPYQASVRFAEAVTS